MLIIRDKIKIDNEMYYLFLDGDINITTKKSNITNELIFVNASMLKFNITLKMTLLENIEEWMIEGIMSNIQKWYIENITS